MDHEEFSHKFIEPIQAGQQSGSTANQRKAMARQLSVLHDHTSVRRLHRAPCADGCV
jgi:hypothetical protein